MFFMSINQTLDIQLFVGIDMSKKKFDACILDLNGKKLGSKKFDNNTFGFDSFIKWVSIQYIEGEIIFCMEHTGVYSRLLGMYIQDEGYNLCMESGFVIKRSGGIVKGKNDKIDAYRIADFALCNKHRIKITPLYDAQLVELHDLMSCRRRLKNQLKALEVPVNEAKCYAGEKAYQIIKQASQAAIKGIKDAIKETDKLIDEKVKENFQWKENLELAQSVKGIGRVTSLWMLVYTRNFDAKMNARKFASLVGIAPFSTESGSSIRKGSHVSNHAHRFLKGLLHACVMSALRNSSKIKAYHIKKKKEGKKGFVVMNNIKNKLVQTVFAVVRSREPYQDTFVHKLAV